MHSINVDSGPFVDQVLIYAPCEYISETFAHYSGCETAKVADKTVMFVDLEQCRPNALVVLGLIFIVKLEEHSCTDDIQRVRD